MMKPVFILGCGRSGTTILGRALSQHHSVTYLHEPRHLWSLCFPETDIWTSDGKMVFTAEDANADGANALEELFYEETRKTCGPVLVEKLPINNFRLPFINRIFPESRFIHIFRNGLEVAGSMAKIGNWFEGRKAGWKVIANHARLSETTASLPELCSNDFERGLLEWRLSVEAVHSFFNSISPDRFTEITYDELVSDPVDTLNSLLIFIGLGKSQAVEDFASREIRRRSERRPVGALAPSAEKIAGDLIRYYERSGKNLSNRAARPNMFIVGAARSGTTSLWQILRRHPQMYMPVDELHKEPGFFSDLRGLNDIETYLDIFSNATEEHKWIGEASTAYLTDQSSAKRLFDFNPDAKIIIMLRNPADRAYSLYNWMVQDGYEYAASFEEAVELENIRSQKNIPNWFEPEYYWNYMYFQSGLYYEQVKRYLEYFGDNVMIIKFEHFSRDTLNIYDDVCSFLSLEKHSVDSQIHNLSRRVLSPSIQFLLRKLTDNFHESGKHLLLAGQKWPFSELYHKYAHNLSAVARLSFKDRIMSTYVMHRLFYCLKPPCLLAQATATKEIRDQFMGIGLSSGKPGRLNPGTKTLLMTKYRSDIEHLSALTNMDFSDWFSA
jgi:hypothetical protein